MCIKIYRIDVNPNYLLFMKGCEKKKKKIEPNVNSCVKNTMYFFFFFLKEIKIMDLKEFFPNP